MGSRLWAALLIAILSTWLAAPARAGAADTASDPSLARAIQLEQSGEARQASDAYRAWLDAHPRPKDSATGDLYVEALLRLSRIEPDARLVQHFLEAAPLEALQPAGRTKVLVAMAQLLDAVGQVDKAQVVYNQVASEETDPVSAARFGLRSATLLYETGRAEESEAQARKLFQDARSRSDTAVAAASLYLVGRIQAATARPDDAIRSWRDVLAAFPDAPVAASACFGVYTLSRSLDRPEEAKEALAILQTRYAQSPEYAMSKATGGTRVTLAPRPTALLEPYLASVYLGPVEAVPDVEPVASVVVAGQEPARASAAPEGSGQESGSLVVVLAGSYTSRENADRHRTQIEDRGFPARIAEIEVRGTRYYRVLVGEATSRERAIALSQRLKDRDMESTLLAVEAQVGG